MINHRHIPWSFGVLSNKRAQKESYNINLMIESALSCWTKGSKVKLMRSVTAARSSFLVFLLPIEILLWEERMRQHTKWYWEGGQWEKSRWRQDKTVAPGSDGSKEKSKRKPKGSSSCARFPLSPSLSWIENERPWEKEKKRRKKEAAEGGWKDSTALHLDGKREKRASEKAKTRRIKGEGKMRWKWKHKRSWKAGRMFGFPNEQTLLEGMNTKRGKTGKRMSLMQTKQQDKEWLANWRGDKGRKQTGGANKRQDGETRQRKTIGEWS